MFFNNSKRDLTEEISERVATAEEIPKDVVWISECEIFEVIAIMEASCFNTERDTHQEQILSQFKLFIFYWRKTSETLHSIYLPRLLTGLLYRTGRKYSSC